jgi:hypothetical protein
MVRVGTRIDKDKDIFQEGAISVLCLVTATAFVQLDLRWRGSTYNCPECLSS